MRGKGKKWERSWIAKRQLCEEVVEEVGRRQLRGGGRRNARGVGKVRDYLGERSM